MRKLNDEIALPGSAVCRRENWDRCVNTSAEVYLDFFGFARLNDSTQYVDRIFSVSPERDVGSLYTLNQGAIVPPQLPGTHDGQRSAVAGFQRLHHTQRFEFFQGHKIFRIVGELNAFLRGVPFGIRCIRRQGVFIGIFDKGREQTWIIWRIRAIGILVETKNHAIRCGATFQLKAFENRLCQRVIQADRDVLQPIHGRTGSKRGIFIIKYDVWGCHIVHQRDERR